MLFDIPGCGGREKNYLGYVVKYGNMTLEDVKALGGIPLTVSFNLSLGLSGSAKKYTYFKVNGTNVLELSGSCWGNGQGGNVNSSHHFDLDTYFGGNLAAMGTCTISIGSIVKWLVPSGQIPKAPINGCNIFISNSSTSVTRYVDYEISALGVLLKKGNIGVPHNQPAVIGVIGNFYSADDVNVKWTGGQPEYMSYTKQMI